MKINKNIKIIDENLNFNVKTDKENSKIDHDKLVYINWGFDNVLERKYNQLIEDGYVR